MDLDAVGRLALLLAHDGHHLVGVGPAECGGLLVDVGHALVPGVGHQGGHLGAAHGAQDFVTGHGVGVLRRSVPAQYDARVAVDRPGAEGGRDRSKGLRFGRDCRRRPDYEGPGDTRILCPGYVLGRNCRGTEDQAGDGPERRLLHWGKTGGEFDAGIDDLTVWGGLLGHYTEKGEV